MTGESINSLPEYFLSVKVAEYLHGYFKSFSFSMEDSIPEVAEEIGMDISGQKECYRLNGNADLIVRGQKSRKLKHFIEFKRNLSTKELTKDALRLSWICANTPSGHKAEKNFLVTVTHRPEDDFKKLTAEFEDLILEEFGANISVKFESVDLSSIKSTHRNARGRSLWGGVWEFRYVA